jgi:hypothetical protein
MTTYLSKITFGEMRASRACEILTYCRDHRCRHHVEVNANGWPGDVRLSDIESKIVFKVRPSRRRGAAGVWASAAKHRLVSGLERYAAQRPGAGWGAGPGPLTPLVGRQLWGQDLD